jgi:hypothetical protein
MSRNSGVSGKVIKRYPFTELLSSWKFKIPDLMIMKKGKPVEKDISINNGMIK